MGVTGTDVATEAAHMVLLDDNFATIVAAVREGRRIFDNIRKFIRYAMTGNSGEIWTLFLAPFLGLPIPLLPIHILWINLVTDGLPGLALAAEPEERGIMQRPPRPPQREHLRARHVAAHRLGRSADRRHCAAHPGVAIHPDCALADHGVHGAHAVAARPRAGRPLRAQLTVRQGLRSNTTAASLAVLFTLALQLATIYVPALNPVFKTAPLDAVELVVCLLMSSVVFFAVEVEKWLIRRGRLYQPLEAAGAMADIHNVVRIDRMEHLRIMH